ncbi:hypothetical protein RN001_004462 [Aquatica leii]|uniref:Chitin-binding type-2 domain-containing protein n=1 Tax=Aquatica leii TaxID=1421715 RepID=A0AAN7SPJ4_9COLE|nr:hypothetical protein RN001_004462 [Aquatica leii]
MLLVLGVIAIIANTQGLNLCSKEDVKSLIPHETDCVKYYECSQGTKIERQCLNGFYFNSVKKQCKICNCNNINRLQFFSHEKSCNKYYMILQEKNVFLDKPTAQIKDNDIDRQSLEGVTTEKKIDKPVTPVLENPSVEVEDVKKDTTKIAAIEKKFAESALVLLKDDKSSDLTTGSIVEAKYINQVIEEIVTEKVKVEKTLR